MDISVCSPKENYNFHPQSSRLWPFNERAISRHLRKILFEPITNTINEQINKKASILKVNIIRDGTLRQSSIALLLSQANKICQFKICC